MGEFIHDEEEDEYIKGKVKAKQAIVEKISNGYVLKDMMEDIIYIAKDSYDVKRVIEKIFEPYKEKTEDI